MPQKNKSVEIELMTLKKPSALDKVLETIPKPTGAIPNFGLPKWKLMALESKIPMVSGPEGSYCFTRQKLGKKLWINLADTEFNLNDPYNYEMKFSYDPLHDEYLAAFFSRPNNIKRMINLGYVTQNLDAKCSLREYNMYRKYLKKLYNYRINHELRLKDQLNHERRILQLAEEQAQREVKRLIKEENRAKKYKEVSGKLTLQKEAQLQKQRENQLKIAQRLERIALAKEKDAYLLRERGKMQAEQIRQKRAITVNIERQKIIKTLMEWHKNETKRKKVVKERATQEQEKRRKAIEEKWNLRKETQQKRIQREQFILQYAQEKRTTFITQYNNKVEKERRKMKSCLKRIKKFTKCYIHKHVAGQKERVCCKNYKHEYPYQLEKNVTENERKTKDKLQKDKEGKKAIKKHLLKEEKSEQQSKSILQTKTKKRVQLGKMKRSINNKPPQQSTKRQCECREIQNK